MDVRRSRAISCLRLGFDYGAHTNPLGRRTFYMSIRIASLSMSTDIDIYSGMLTVGFSTDFGQRDVSVLLTYTAPVLSYAKSDQSSRVCPRALRKWKRILSRARSGGGKESIRQGESNSVRIMVRTFMLRPNEHRRKFLSDGSTAPYKLPEYVPVVRDVKSREKNGNPRTPDYPALLTPTKAPRNTYRPKSYRHSPDYPVRPMPQKVPATHQRKQ